ncbi:hypothetical protein QR680_017965 [Steinernema hermaphroditum]|uniref:Uncharacterized protein n=1 Tax=Steinernema hermaphroditum TaxID=289476 RepID=A0AA39LPM1_9BILA|nr:hypothetical protein QR680_017965 [Steinernema hermaphroditum]
MAKVPSFLYLGRVCATGLLNAPRRAQSLDRLATFVTSATATKDDIFISPKSEVRRSDRAHPLMGVKVALLTRPTAGEFTAKMLADFGADVTKLWDPYKSNDTMKEGREINLETLEGQNLVRNIARKVDVLIDNLTAGRLEEIGIDPEQMMRSNSRLIFARISGYGQTGRLGKTTCGADATYAGMSGALSRIEHGDEHELKETFKEAEALYAAARANCVMGIVMALYDREHTGKGQILDISLTENIAYVQRVARTSRLGIPPAFNRFYACKDGKCIAVGLKDPKEQEDFMKKLGLKSSGKDAKKELINLFKTKNQQEWLSLFKESGSVTPLLSNEEAANHSHHKQRHFFEIDKSTNQCSAKPVPRFPKERS